MAPIILGQGLWDPYKVLDIHPGDLYFSCVGIAVSTGRRCRWDIDGSKCGAACDELNAMATKHPSEVTKDTLISLAEHVLCRDWHQRQKYEKVAQWKGCIAMFLDEFNHQVAMKSEPKQLSTELEEARRQDQADILEKEKKNLTLLGETMESTQRELRKTRLECRESKDKLTAEADGLRSQLKDLQKSQTRNASEVPSLKGRLAESVSIVQTLKKSETQMLCQITTLNERLAESASTTRTLKGTDAARLEDVGRLQTELSYKNISSEQRKTAHSQEINELNQRLKASELRFQILKTTSDVEISSLRQDLWNLEADSEENGRVQRKAAETARQRLIDSNALIEKLKVTSSKGTASLLRELEDSNQALLETKNQQNQKLKTREYLGTFCLLNKQRRCERAERESLALSEQAEQLEKQLAAAGEHLAVQNVRTSPEFCRKIKALTLDPAQETLSFFKLQALKKGVRALISTHPLRISIRRIPKNKA